MARKKSDKKQSKIVSFFQNNHSADSADSQSSTDHASHATIKPNEETKKIKDAEYDKKTRVRSFQQNWRREFSWLEFKDSKMFCSVCTQLDRDQSGAFVVGSTSFHRHSLVAHCVSKTHVKCELEKKALEAAPGTTTAEKNLEQLCKKTFQQISNLFRNAHALAKQGRPFTDFVWLCQLDKRKGVDVYDDYISDKQAANFCHYIAELQLMEIRQLFDKTPFITLISDGSTDSASLEAEILYLRCVYEGQIYVKFICVKNVHKANAETIVKTIDDSMKMKVNPAYSKKLVGMGTDGASVMRGKISGVVARMKKLSGNNKLLGIHCAGHRLELAFKIIRDIPGYKKAEVVLSGLYYLYKSSSLCRAGLIASYNALDVPRSKMYMLTRVGGTRFVGHHKRAVSNLLNGWPAIIQHLQQLGECKDSSGKTSAAKASGFLKYLLSKSGRYFLGFLLDTLCVLTEVSKSFQKVEATVGDILFEIEMAKENLEKLEKEDGHNLRKVKSAGGVLAGDTTSFDASRKAVISQLLDALDQRFTEGEDVELIHACRVVNLCIWPANIRDEPDFGDHEIKMLIDYFDETIERAGMDSHLCEQEWTKLKKEVYRRNADVQSLRWNTVFAQLQQLTPNVLGLVTLILTFPAASTDAERGFSHMKVIKSDWRSCLTDDRVSELMQILLNSPGVKDFNPAPAVHLWSTECKRARHAFKKAARKSASKVLLAHVPDEAGEAVDSVSDEEAEGAVGGSLEPDGMATALGQEDSAAADDSNSGMATAVGQEDSADDSNSGMATAVGQDYEEDSADDLNSDFCYSDFEM